jgi:chromosome segregation ATPase
MSANRRKFGVGPEREYEANMSALEQQLESSQRMFEEADEERKTLRSKLRSLQRYVDEAESSEARILEVVKKGFANTEDSLGKLSDLPRQIKVLDADVANLNYRFTDSLDTRHAQEEAQTDLQKRIEVASTKRPAGTHIRSESKVLNAVHTDLQASKELHHRAFTAIAGMVEKSNTWTQQILATMLEEPARPIPQIENIQPILEELEQMSLAFALL